MDDYMVTIDEMMERAIMNWLDERTELLSILQIKRRWNEAKKAQ